jgi:hypothetical protein
MALQPALPYDPTHKRFHPKHPEMFCTEEPPQFQNQPKDQITETLCFHRKDLDLAVTSFDNEPSFPSLPKGSNTSDNLQLASYFPVEG